MGLVLIEFINENTSDNFSIVVNLTELNSNDSFGKRHQYQAADSNFLLELNIKKDEGHPVPGKLVNYWSMKCYMFTLLLG